MIKLRNARYCNLKLLLIYLVVYGHWIEAGIWDSATLIAQYRWIYLVHMPLFSFLSGLFLKSEKACLQQVRRTLPLYLLLQAAAVLLGGGAVRWHTPYWHLWYLLSCCFWAGFGWLWYRFGRGRGKLLILMISILIACGAGYVSWIGRVMSLSRTLVFFPYFFAGMLCRADFPWQRLRWLGFATLALVAAFMVCWGNSLPVTFLYQAASFGSVEKGFTLRLLCYAIGALLCIFLLSAMPDKRFPFTRAGADTLPVYLLHAPLVLLLRKQPIPWLLCPVLCAGLIYGVYKIRQWNSHLFGITAYERSDSRWLRFRKFTKNTHGRYTDSCCR